jgi:hypothetical protein
MQIKPPRTVGTVCLLLKFKSVRTYSRDWRNLVYIYLRCAEPAFRASNVPIFKVSQHYLLIEHSEFKVYGTLIWTYSAITRSIFCCVPKHARCYRRIIMQILRVPTPADVQASHSLKMLPNTCRTSTWNTSNQFTFENCFSCCKECRFSSKLYILVCATNNNQTDSSVGVRKPQSMNYQSLSGHWKMYYVSHDTVIHQQCRSSYSVISLKNGVRINRM